MERKQRIPGPTGEMVDAYEVGFRSGTEHWNEYLLDDGSVLRMKLVAQSVYRIEGQYDEMGNPLYIVRSSNLLNVSSPDDLRKNS